MQHGLKMASPLHANMPTCFHLFTFMHAYIKHADMHAKLYPCMQNAYMHAVREHACLLQALLSGMTCKPWPCTKSDLPGGSMTQHRILPGGPHSVD
jgi:hypothetical protein